MIDFVMSENSMGFHAPQEAMRILGDAINLCRLGQLSLHGGPPPSHNPPNIAQGLPGDMKPLLSGTERRRATK